MGAPGGPAAQRLTGRGCRRCDCRRARAAAPGSARRWAPGGLLGRRRGAGRRAGAGAPVRLDLAGAALPGGEAGEQDREADEDRREDRGAAGQEVRGAARAHHAGRAAAAGEPAAFRALHQDERDQADGDERLDDEHEGEQAGHRRLSGNEVAGDLVDQAPRFNHRRVQPRRPRRSARRRRRSGWRRRPGRRRHRRPRTVRRHCRP